MSGTHLHKNVHALVPPERGSFPLDHYNICKKYMLDYMICVTENNRDNSKCRIQSKAYLSCRMDNNLMAKEDWDYLGFKDSTTEATVEQDK